MSEEINNIDEENVRDGEAAAPEEEAAEKKSFNLGKEIWEWVYTLAIAIAVALLIKAFVFDIVRVDGSSMYPTLVDNDRLVVTRLGYEPKQGDIVILDSTYKKREAYYDELAAEEGKDKLSAIDKLLARKDMPESLETVYYVKRIIATEGQTVDLGDDGYVYIDGEKLDEPYYDGATLPIDSAMQFPLTVEEDTVFVMGDNRMHSKDSRSSDLGLVPCDAILGKSQLRIWPFDSISFTK